MNLSNLNNRFIFLFSATLLGTAIASSVPPILAPARAVVLPAPTLSPAHLETAGLFHTIDILEDVDDALDGDFGDIDPIRDVTESVEDVVDDVTDTYNDVTNIRIWEPFTDVDDQVEDFVDDVDDTMRHVSNDIEDWFD